MSPPYSWYQSLNQVHIEIKFAYRHDVAGCATLFNETIDITPERFHVRASCAETQDTNSLYILQFPFWNLVNATDYKM